ncbi:cyclic nucleotide-binding domain-containing protein [Actinoplanes sp. NPDC020271]|uniref:cyclic nucleotide-binding domain-containing protein n=1 Tax=Actinoplanes sp. NPDC020271 TaxID=3363896 RepID=UPI0037B6ACE6
MSGHPFLTGLTPRLLTELFGCDAAVRYPPGHRIFSEGGAADHFWTIETGDVNLSLAVPGRGEQVLETIGPGEVLGWSWLYPPFRWRFGATTRTEVVATEFDAALVRARCAADPELGYEVLRRFVPVLGHRLTATRLRLLDLWGRP